RAGARGQLGGEHELRPGGRAGGVPLLPAPGRPVAAGPAAAASADPHRPRAGASRPPPGPLHRLPWAGPGAVALLPGGGPPRAPGAAGWFRFLRVSRIVERVGARRRARAGRPGPPASPAAPRPAVREQGTAPGALVGPLAAATG